MTNDTMREQTLTEKVREHLGVIARRWVCIRARSVSHARGPRFKSGASTNRIPNFLIETYVSARLLVAAALVHRAHLFQIGIRFALVRFALPVRSRETAEKPDPQRWLFDARASEPAAVGD